MICNLTEKVLGEIVDAENPRERAVALGLLPARKVMKAGDVVRLSMDGKCRRGVVAGPLVSRLVNNEYHFGTFVIVAEGVGGTNSFSSEQSAADAGWAVEE